MIDMRSQICLIALLLGALLLMSVAACSREGSEMTSEPTSDTADTRAPETSSSLTDSSITSEEPALTVGAMPDTSFEEQTEETAPPARIDTIRILMQKDRGEAITSAFADEKDKELLDERESILFKSYLLRLEVTRVSDIASTVLNDSQASQLAHDLFLLSAEDGIALLNDGLLEDLSEAGINISTSDRGINSTLTESLSLGGRIYLLSSIALASDLTSSHAVRYDGTPLSSSPTEKALAGELTAELMLSYIKEAENAFSLGEAAPLLLYRGLGGRIYDRDSVGMPISAVINSTSFTAPYSATLELRSEACAEKAIFTLERLTSLQPGEIYLPIPKASAEQEYSTPTELGSVSLIAAPFGVVSGSRLRYFIASLTSASDNYRESLRGDIIENGASDSRRLLDIIESRTSLDLGELLGWGDIDKLIEDGLTKGSSADSILTNRVTEMRNQVVEVAASIIADKLGIKH